MRSAFTADAGAGGAATAPRRPVRRRNGEIATLADATLTRPAPEPTTGHAWERLMTNRNWLGFWFMLPAAAFLLLFLAYPLGYGVWLSMTDARVGRGGEFVALENYTWLWDDDVFWLSVFNTFLYTAVASVFKFAIGLYLALLLNKLMPF